jgi:hypothetical protein
MTGRVSLMAVAHVPDGIAQYPVKDANNQTITLDRRVIFSTPRGRLLVSTLPIPANRGGAVLVSQKSLDKLSGTTSREMTDVEWRPAKRRDVFRYSSQTRWRVISAALALISGAAALVKVIAGSSWGDGASTTTIVIVIVAARLTFAKQAVDVVKDFKGG